MKNTGMISQLNCVALFTFPHSTKVWEKKNGILFASYTYVAIKASFLESNYTYKGQRNSSRALKWGIVPS